MIRILFFLLVVFAVGLGLAWLADRPGDMVVTFEGYRYEVSLLVAAVACVAAVAAVMLLWWVLKGIWNSPHRVSRYFRARKRDRGYQALSTGMIAAGAGDSTLARRMNAQAVKLIRADQEPLIQLLDAQASLLEGDHAGARAKFEAMLEHGETRLLGLRGLYLEAERLGDRGAARHYAGRAAELAPQLHWASESTLEEKTEAGDWSGALKLLDARKPSRDVERERVASGRAVLLTAQSMSILDTDPAGARNAALEAVRIRPDFVPAALAAARALFRLDDTRKGAKVLEAVWKLDPHPQVAELYVHARHGDSTHDRLTRARRLQDIKRNNVESALVVARAALAAHEFDAAREAAEAALRMGPREGIYLLLAEIEEASTGDEGRMRYYLAKALRAPRDPVWMADGLASDQWAPASPVTGRLDAFEWRAPVERVGQVIEMEDEPPRAALPPSFADEINEEPPEASPVIAEPAADVLPSDEDPAPAVASPPFKTSAASVDGQAPPLPDDPGVDASKAEAGRFRLF